MLLGAVEGHRRPVRGRRHRRGLVSRFNTVGPRAEVRGDAGGQDDRRARGKLGRVKKWFFIFIFERERDFFPHFFSTSSSFSSPLLSSPLLSSPLSTSLLLSSPLLSQPPSSSLHKKKPSKTKTKTKSQELGGVDEYTLVDALKEKRITKPVVAWASGTCAPLFKSEVQFGHAGARSGSSDAESAAAKNKALRDAGAVVPDSFEGFEAAIKKTYEELVAAGKAPAPRPRAERSASAPSLPLDLAAAKRSGVVRVPTNVVSTICDDRGEEPTYAGVPMSELITSGAGVGDAVSLLWFKRRLPAYAVRFIEICIVLCADHGYVEQDAPSAFRSELFFFSSRARFLFPLASVVKLGGKPRAFFDNSSFFAFLSFSSCSSSSSACPSLTSLRKEKGREQEEKLEIESGDVVLRFSEPWG